MWLTLFTILALAVLIALGTWQVNRMHWKIALIAAVDERLAAAPVAIPNFVDWGQLEPDDFRYRRVLVQGMLLHEHQQFSYMVINEPQGGPNRGQGYWVMTPLLMEDGNIVWINRGFVPMEKAEAGFEVQTTEPVEIIGLMRQPELPNFATPGDDNGRDKNIWFIRNIEAMSAETGLNQDQIAPFFIDAQSLKNNELPQGGETRVAFSNRHLGYVITWYGLALALLGVYGAVAYRESKKGRE